MMNKRESLQMIVGDIESLADMSKFYPEIFNWVVSDKELEQLGEVVSDLATNVEIQIYKRMVGVFPLDGPKKKKVSLSLVVDNVSGRSR